MKKLLSAAVLALLASVAHADPTLLGHKALPAQALDADGIKAVLLGKRVTLGDVRVVVVIAKESAAQDAFLQQHVGMNTSQFQNHWRRLFMTGGGSAPKIADNEADACKLAAETAGSVTIGDSGKAAGLVVLVK